MEIDGSSQDGRAALPVVLARGEASQCYGRLGRTEARVRALTDTISSSVVDLCLCLGEIQTHKLYSEIGLPDFTSYLATRRIDVPYKTAMNYALVGSMMIRYRKELDAVGYDPIQHGVNKLRLVAHALRKSYIPRANVFEKLVNNSYRGLQRYLESCREDETSERQPAVHVRVEQDCITVNCSSGWQEIVWVDGDAFHNESILREFVTAVAELLGGYVDQIKLNQFD